MKTLWMFFGVITKLDYIKWSFLCLLWSFLKVKVKNRGYFLGLPKFQIFFLGYLKFLIIFWVNGRCWARAYVCRKIGVHDKSSKDTSSNTTISLQRQLVYYDSLSNATLSLLLFLPTTFGRKNVHIAMLFGWRA